MLEERKQNILNMQIKNTRMRSMRLCTNSSFNSTASYPGSLMIDRLDMASTIIIEAIPKRDTAMRTL